MKIRKMLNNSNRQFSPCNICDVDGTMMGKKKFNLFQLMMTKNFIKKKVLIFRRKFRYWSRIIQINSLKMDGQ